MGLKLNRKVKDLAKMSALAHKAKANAIVMVKISTLMTPKTRQFTAALKGLESSR